MSLDKKVIKDFVAAVNKKEETKTPTILTGTVHREGGTVSVKIDGSESLTPVSTVVFIWITMVSLCLVMLTSM